MLAPVLPEIGERTGTGPGVAGALVACFAVGQLAGYPIAGALGKRRSPAVLLGCSLTLLLVGDALFVAGDGLAAWFPARAVHGVAAAGLWIGITFSVLGSWPTTAYQRLAGVLGAYGVGSVIGPAFGAVEGIRAPFALHAGATAAAFLVLPVLRSRGRHAALRSDRAALRTRAFAVSAAGIVLISVGVGTIDGPLPLHLGEQLSQTPIAALYVLTALVIAAGAAAAGRARPWWALASAAVVIPIGIGVVGATNSVAPWILGLVVVGAGLGAGEAGALGFLLDSTEREQIVAAWVVWSQLWAVGYLVGPLASGLAAETWGYGALGLVALTASGVVAVALGGAGHAARLPGQQRDRHL